MSLASPFVPPAQVENHPRELAPIALFVYRRPDHTERTVNALRQNHLAAASDLFVFSDAAKNESSAAAVQQVREYVHGIRGFRSTTVIERNRNLGLGKSIIDGVSYLCAEFGRVIAIEDDILTTPDFLTFMNRALERYQQDPRVFSVSGFNFGLPPTDSFPYDAFCFYRSSSLGWATWSDRWDKADWQVSDYREFLEDNAQQAKFHRGGTDLSRMLKLQMIGKLDSWAIRWAYAHHKNDGLALLSLRPRVFHIGDDGSGTYTRKGALPQTPLTSESKSEFQFPSDPVPEPKFTAELQKILRPSLLRRFARSVRDRIP